MRRILRIGAIATALACVVGCASAGSSGQGSDAVLPPQMVSRTPPPALRITTPPMASSGRPQVRVDIEVMIDADGRPDMSTFKVTGFGASENQDALRRWIEEASFQPARRGDHTLPGLYRSHLEVEVRRM
jgi:hypothetical protein